MLSIEPASAGNTYCGRDKPGFLACRNPRISGRYPSLTSSSSWVDLCFWASLTCAIYPALGVDWIPILPLLWIYPHQPPSDSSCGRATRGFSQIYFLAETIVDVLYCLSFRTILKPDQKAWNNSRSASYQAGFLFCYRGKMPSFTIFKRGARDFINKSDKREQTSADGDRSSPPPNNSNVPGQEQEQGREQGREQESGPELKPFGKKQPLKELIRRATVSRRGRPAKLQRRRSAMVTSTTSRTRSVSNVPSVRPGTMPSLASRPASCTLPVCT